MGGICSCFEKKGTKGEIYEKHLKDNERIFDNSKATKAAITILKYYRRYKLNKENPPIDQYVKFLELAKSFTSPISLVNVFLIRKLQKIMALLILILYIWKIQD